MVLMGVLLVFSWAYACGIARAESAETDGGKTLVVYYSATGHTEAVANDIAETLNADLFQLIPTEPYSDADLDWTDENSRVCYEHEHPEDREVELEETTVEGWESYNTVFIGYPIWWGNASWVVDGFIAANDFTGKTVIPFCTSSSSGFGESGELLAEAAGTGDWLEGKRFSSSADAEEVAEWVSSLALPAETAAEQASDETAEEDADVARESTDVLMIADQGIFSAGGTVTESDGTFDVSSYYTSREGSTSHVDHANVLYQIPAEETGLPMVFLHGYGQSRMSWMTTPDGREGWSDMFLRMGHGVFLIDQPRRGEAGQTSVAGTISTEPSDQTWYTQFRIGTYIDGAFTYNENSQFPQGEEVLDQFFRQMTPDTAMDSANGDQNIDTTVVAQAVAAAIDEVYERTGKDSILVTHSQGGMPGWETARYTDHIAAIIAIEPGGAPMTDSEDYQALVEKQIPVAFYYGDYIGEEFTDVPAAGMWTMMKSSADVFEEAYTAAGGTCTVVSLPDEGIYGNDHMMFQDLNNDVIAEHIENWIQSTLG